MTKAVKEQRMNFYFDEEEKQTENNMSKGEYEKIPSEDFLTT